MDRPEARVRGVDDEFTSGLRLRVARPDVPPGFVRRERLDRMLTQGRRRSRNPAECRTGIRQDTWLSQRGPKQDPAPGPVAWITADARDDVQGLWATVLGAMTLVDALPRDSAVRSLVPGREFGIPEVARIIAELSLLPAPVVVVLDDLHRVTDPRVLASLTQLLDHQPDQLRLVLLSRAEPALGLGRRRLAGRVTDIHAETLAFTEAESFALCARSGVTLSTGQAAMLWMRTEGWPAGLRLILLGLDTDDIAGGLQRIGGYRHDRLVAGYLVEEVLEQLPPTDRRFLLGTSVVDEINSDLARALTGRPDSQSALDGLVARNALTVRLHDRPDWFRYHPLLRSLLQERLLAEQPDSVPDLHRRAAEWYAADRRRHHCVAAPRARP